MSTDFEQELTASRNYPGYFFLVLLFPGPMGYKLKNNTKLIPSNHKMER